MNYFTTAEQEIPDWLIKTAFLKEVETTVRLGMKSWFCPLSLACDPIWDFLPLFWPCGICSVVSDSLQPYGLQPARLPVHQISQAGVLEWVAISFSRDLPYPGIKPASPVSPALQADSLPAEPSVFLFEVMKMLWNLTGRMLAQTCVYTINHCTCV